MGKKTLRRMGLALSALLLAVLVGCKAVGGLSLNDAIVNQLDVTSAESKSLIELQLNWDEAKLAKEDEEVRKQIALFSHLKLSLDATKTDNKGDFYLNGKLIFDKGPIPFTLQGNTQKMLLQVSGAKRPLLLDASALNTQALSGLGGIPLTEGKSNANQAVEEVYKKVMKQTMSYVVGHLPNPAKIDAEPATVAINGTDTDLIKVHAELGGKEIGELIPVFLDALLSDSQGLRELLNQLAGWSDYLPPQLKEELGLSASGKQPTQEEITQTIQYILDGLKEFRDGLDEAKKEPEWNQLFNDSLTYKSDWYVDKSLQIRKSLTDVKLGGAIFGEAEIPLTSITLHTEVENWNLNGDVQVPPLQVPANVLTSKDLFTMEPYQLMKELSVDSVVYDVLKNDLQADDQSIWLSSEWGIPYLEDKGKVYVPVKETARLLGDQVSYITAKKQVRIYDEPTYQEIILTVGADKALVNGKEKKLSAKVFQVDGITYAAADDLLGILHAKYEVTEDDDGPSLHITRDL